MSTCVPYSQLQQRLKEIDTNGHHSYLEFTSIPILDWIQKYTKDDLYNDIIAGVTVFVLLIPQGMAYALLSGLPAIYGLYSSTVGLFVYSVLGTSKHISLGPMAITSLLVSSCLMSLGISSDSSDIYITYAMNLSMCFGIISFLLGTLRLGVLSNFLSTSVLSGFITASALVISLSQLKYIFGISIPRFQYSHQTIFYLLTHLHESNPYAVTLGIGSWIILYMIKWYKTTHKNSSANIKLLINLSSLIAIIIGSTVAFLIVSHDHKYGQKLQIIGFIPAGLLRPGFIFLPMNIFLKLIPQAFLISLISFTGNWAVCKKYASMFDYEVDSNQELIAYGLANIFGVIFHGYILSGGLARTSVNVEAGARTLIAAVISGLLMIIALLSITKFFYYIPMAVLASIIEVSVASMIDINILVQTYYVDKNDFFVMLATCICTFFVGIQEGLFIGICCSMAFVIKASSFPHIAILGRLRDHIYKDILRYPEAIQIPSVAIVRMDATLYFANSQHFKEILNKVALGSFHSSKECIKLIILDVSMWIQPDATGILVLREIHKDLLQQEIQLAFANAKGSLRDRLLDVKFTETVGVEYFYESIESAVNGLSKRRENLMTEISLTKRDNNSTLMHFNSFISAKIRSNFQSVDVESPMHTQNTTPTNYNSVYANGEGI